MPDTPKPNDIELTIRGKRVEVQHVRMEVGIDDRVLVLAMSVLFDEVVPPAELSEVFTDA